MIEKIKSQYISGCEPPDLIDLKTTVSLFLEGYGRTLRMWEVFDDAYDEAALSVFEDGSILDEDLLPFKCQWNLESLINF